MATAAKPSEATDREAALRLLVIEQERDDKRCRLYPRRDEVQESSLAAPLDSFPDPETTRPPGPLRWPGHVVGMRIAWDASTHRNVLGGKSPCPVCDGKPCKGDYCLMCDTTGIDDLIEWRGHPVGSGMDPDWPVDDLGPAITNGKRSRRMAAKLRGGVR